jgi:hypothetical protein
MERKREREREMERKGERAIEEALPHPRILRFLTLFMIIQNASLLTCTPVPGENAVAGGMKYIRNGGAPLACSAGSMVGQTGSNTCYGLIGL